MRTSLQLLDFHVQGLHRTISDQTTRLISFFQANCGIENRLMLAQLGGLCGHNVFSCVCRVEALQEGPEIESLGEAIDVPVSWLNAFL